MSGNEFMEAMIEEAHGVPGFSEADRKENMMIIHSTSLRSLKFYIATRLERTGDHKALARELVQAGHAITYDWTVHGSVQGPQRIREVAQAELAGIKAADVVIVLLPGGRGTHAELGMALALGKPVIILGDLKDTGGRHCAFYYLAHHWQAGGWSYAGVLQMLNDLVFTSKPKLQWTITGDDDFDDMIGRCRDILKVKGVDYTQGGPDRLSNFKETAKFMGLTARQALGTYLYKHVSAIFSFLKRGQVESEPIEGRIADVINYMLLLYKMVNEEKRNAALPKP
jgi:hypothetical protein